MIRSYQGKTPKIHPSAFVSEFAYVVGDVEVGEHSSIWPGAVIRGDRGKITIGGMTNIQDNSVVHSDADAWLGNGVVIGHSVVCHAARIGDHCLIGNNATLNDGVDLGANCVVASNAMVLENVRIDAYSLVVGVPAYVKSKVTEKHMTLVKETAKSYMVKASLYKEQGL
jgi:carbonic anhydrase/acetyltransferase-like protein (isoleucine patch superfamily)